jgi:N-acetylglucosamine malate deacetylase 1
MLQESEIVPYHLSRPSWEKALVLAPHPDDETLGCGGVIRSLVESKKLVKVVFLTSGDKGDPAHPLSGIKHSEEHITDYSLMREKEAIKALRVLGVSDYEFLRFPDRELYLHSGKILERLLKITGEYAPDAVFSPSIIELNPDHRTTAQVSLKMHGTMNSEDKKGVRSSLVFYEVTTPFRPNMLIDITSGYNRKKKAIRKYKSQLKITDYLNYIAALNTVRSLTVRGPRYVEAFWVVEAFAADEDIAKWLSYQTAL